MQVKKRRSSIHARSALVCAVCAVCALCAVCAVCAGFGRLEGSAVWYLTLEPTTERVIEENATSSSEARATVTSVRSMLSTAPAIMMSNATITLGGDGGGNEGGDGGDGKIGGHAGGAGSGGEGWAGERIPWGMSGCEGECIGGGDAAAMGVDGDTKGGEEAMTGSGGRGGEAMGGRREGGGG